MRELVITTSSVYEGDQEMLSMVAAITVNEVRVGHIVATDSGHDRQAHISWEIDPLFRGMGFTSWSLQQSLPKFLERWNRLVAIIRPGNVASKALAAKAGFTLEGVAREGRYIDGAFEDVEHWAIIARDLERGK